MEPTPHPLPPVPRRWPVRLILVGIVFALVLPGLVFCAVLIDRIANGERARSEAAVEAAVSRVADSLDRELGSLSAALVALATSPALDSGDMAAFDVQARALAETIGQAVVLSDTNGQQLVNTRRPYGTPMPLMVASEAFRAALDQHRTAVSGLFTGATSSALSVAVLHPVLRGKAGQMNVRYVLAMNLQPLYLSSLLERQGLPPGWIATVTDHTGRILARTVQPARFIGQPLPIAGGVGREERSLQVTNSLEGVQVLAGLQWLRLAEWRVGIGAPMRLLQAPLRMTIGLLGITGVITLGLAVLLAWQLARSVAEPLQALAGMGRALGEGQVPQVRSAIAEVDAVATALAQAHEVSARFTESLENQVALRTAELEDVNQRLRDAIDRGAQAEEQLRQSQKMEAVGQLTGGIAHDFNNLLTIVIGSLDLLRRRAPDERQKRLLDNAMEGASRAATLTARLLAFSRRQPLQPQPVDVNALVVGMSDLMHRTLGETVQLETVLAGGVWRTLVDPNQLENALLNLVVNGRDALATAKRPGGRLVIETANATLDTPELDPDVPPGPFVEISVSDGGTGMPAEIVGRVFEPFFTTKPPGKGTGLGLSQVHGFVKQSGGQVRIRTAPDEGTTVTIHLPRFDGQPDHPAAADQEEIPPSGLARQVVLVVEDDGGVRRFSVDALHDLGCTVLEADGAEAALRTLDAHPEVSLLLTDVVLPGTAGPALAAEALRRRPDLAVLFASGYTGLHPGATETAQALPPGAVLLQKPFTVKALAARIREVLGERLMRPAGLEPATKPL